MPFFKKKKEVEAELTVPEPEQVKPEFEKPKQISQPISKIENYNVEVGCSNCGVVYTLEIPKGTPVSEVMKEDVCENCGCKGYFVRISKEE